MNNNELTRLLENIFILYNIKNNINELLKLMTKQPPKKVTPIKYNFYQNDYMDLKKKYAESKKSISYEFVLKSGVYHQQPIFSLPSLSFEYIYIICNELLKTKNAPILLFDKTTSTKLNIEGDSNKYLSHYKDDNPLFLFTPWPDFLIIIWGEENYIIYTFTDPIKSTPIKNILTKFQLEFSDNQVDYTFSEKPLKSRGYIICWIFNIILNRYDIAAKSGNTILDLEIHIDRVDKNINYDLYYDLLVKTVDPLIQKTGGSKNYEHKHIKYKQKYLLLKNT